MAIVAGVDFGTLNTASAKIRNTPPNLTRTTCVH